MLRWWRRRRQWRLARRPESWCQIGDTPMYARVEMLDNPAYAEQVAEMLDQYIESRP